MELGPFDYESEVHTPSLWVAEGITSYYDHLLRPPRRALHASRSTWPATRRARPAEDKPNAEIERLQDDARPAGPAAGDRPRSTPGSSSTGATRTSPNTAISYYTKGAVVGFLLDARIRRATDGERSLDDVMRLAYDRYSGRAGLHRPSSSAPWRARWPGTTSRRWFDRRLETTEELDYAEALDWYGLRFAAKAEKKAARRSQAAEGLARAGDQGRGRPAGRDPGQAGHARLRRPASTSATRSSRSATTGSGPAVGPTDGAVSAE